MSQVIEIQNYYAHTPNGYGQWHDLKSHLEQVAAKAAKFAADFGGEAHAYWAGLLHDLGKFNPAFQRYLHACHEGKPASPVGHAIWGTALVYFLMWKRQQDAEGWKEIALAIGGHHAGLNNCGELGQKLEAFLENNQEALKVMYRALQLLPAPPTLWPSNRLDSRDARLRREFFIRMIFSSLVDADYLDTEAHFDPERVQLRSRWPALHDLWPRFQKNREDFLRRKQQLHYGANETTSPVYEIRREVYDACLQAADGRPGVYRLTVPTGGGKTLSGLAFALKHACNNRLQRVVAAIPYTSIIDQTVRVYREVLGEDAVLEHHSQVPVPEDETQGPDSLRLRLASENWDAPVIVTTTVQLFESLLSNRPSRVRKLHNLARSVILLDEVQALPVEILRPTLDVLRTLVEDYGVSLVLSSATQPVFENTPYVKEFEGLAVQEIVADYPRHFQLMKRVRYFIREQPVSWEELAVEIRAQPQVMVVLNSRRDALELLAAIGDDPDVFHLSTLLCAAHRQKVLAEIAERLIHRKPVRLISTQVIEAGVDLDFPLVYRAVGPLDRIVQAAGRCNREGRLSTGEVIVFEPAHGCLPGGPYKAGLEVSRTLLSIVMEKPEMLHQPELYQDYFAELFSIVPLDKHNIQIFRTHLDYPKVAELYCLIPDETVPVLVDYMEGLERLQEWRRQPSLQGWRRLQPYLVNLFCWEVERLERNRWLEPVGNSLYRWFGSYDDRVGLVQAVYDPADLILS